MRFSLKPGYSILKTAVASVWEETPDRDDAFNNYKNINIILFWGLVSLNNLLFAFRFTFWTL